MIVPAVTMNVGDHYAGRVIGVLDYNFGLFVLEATTPLVAVHDGVTPESTTPAGANELSVATFNVENLDPGDPQAKFDRLAQIIVANMKLAGSPRARGGPGQHRARRTTAPSTRT